MSVGDRLVRILNHHLDKVLFVLGLGYLGAVGYWLVTQRQPPSPQLAQVPTLEQDGKFIAQLQRSLQKIPPTPSTNLLPLSLPASPPPPPRPTTIIEKHYYPVYPPSSPPPALQPPAPMPLPASPTAIAPMVTKKQTYQLIGVLEAGDQSSALFASEEGSFRIQVQESLGASGWVLAKVSEQRAILTRQGKTRYLEVGQSF